MLVNNVNKCMFPIAEENIALSLKGINKKFNNKKLIAKNINLDIFKGEIFSILGETGSGKTTILRIITGFEQPDSGEIIVAHQYVYKNQMIVNPEKRDIGIIFQQCTLFPHMNVLNNIEFGISHLKKDYKSQVITETINKLKIGDIINHFPYELSGGQQQKVALARTLVTKPKIILFDEAFSSLDKNLRVTLRNEIKELIKDNNITAIFVTHDQEEAFALSDRIAIIKNGEILQVDTPINMYKNPKDEYVANFLGKTNFLDGAFINGNFLGNFGEIKTNKQLIENEKYKLMIRPESIHLTYDKIEGSLKGNIIKSDFLGHFSEVLVNIQGNLLKCISLKENYFKDNKQVYVRFNQVNVI